MSTIFQYIVAVDPGRHKCGLALVNRDGSVWQKKIVETSGLTEAVTEWLRLFPESIIVLGDRTTSKQTFQRLKPLGKPVQLIDEDRSSMEGRYRFLKENTRGLARLVPIGLRVPTKPFDDYVAVILAERFLKSINQPLILTDKDSKEGSI